MTMDMSLVHEIEIAKKKKKRQALTVLTITLKTQGRQKWWKKGRALLEF